MLDPKTYTFLKVCDEMNYTRAAKKLHITQPAVSQHIAALEEFYHVALFHKDGKKLSLTREGKLLQESFLQLESYELGLQKHLDWMTDRKQNLRFGVTLTVGEFLITRQLCSFLHAYPDAEVSLRVANTRSLLAALSRNQIDFAILEGDYASEEYAGYPYLQDSFIPICGADYTFAKEPETLADLTRERVIVRERGSGTRTILEASLTEHNLQLSDFRSRIEIGNMFTIKELVRNCCGITFLYQNAVEKELKSGEIRQIYLKDYHVTHEISTVWNKDSTYAAELQSMIHEFFQIRENSKKSCE